MQTRICASGRVSATFSTVFFLFFKLQFCSRLLAPCGHDSLLETHSHMIGLLVRLSYKTMLHGPVAPNNKSYHLNIQIA